MTMAISKAAEDGAKAVICASTGNTSASAAAYAVRAGMVCAVLVPAGKIAMGKLAQALVHGAVLLQVDGNFDDCLVLARELSENYPVALVNPSTRCASRARRPAALRSSTSWATPLTSTACRWATPATSPPTGRATSSTPPTARPRAGHGWGVPGRGAAPIVIGHPVPKPQTIATAIRIGNPASWEYAEAARDESGGLIDMVTDRDILAAYHLLAAEEGVFVEPASAASVAGLLKAQATGKLDAGQRIVHRHRERPEGPRVGAFRRAGPGGHPG